MFDEAYVDPTARYKPSTRRYIFHKHCWTSACSEYRASVPRW